MGVVVFLVYYLRENIGNKYDYFNMCILNAINYVIVFCGYLHSFWCVEVTGQRADFMML
jgi:hypothetical protein